MVMTTFLLLLLGIREAVEVVHFSSSSSSCAFKHLIPPCPSLHPHLRVLSNISDHVPLEVTGKPNRTLAQGAQSARGSAGN